MYVPTQVNVPPRRGGWTGCPLAVLRKSLPTCEIINMLYDN